MSAHDIERKPFAERLIAAARRDSAAPALLHKERGAWVLRRWSEVLEEIDRLAAGLKQLGLDPGDRVAVEGQVTARLFLAGAAIRAAGGRILAVHSSASGADRSALLAEPSLALVIAQGREALAEWSEAARAQRRVPIVFDHATPDSRPPAEGIVTLAALRSLGERERWSADGAVALGTRPLPVTWFEESTDWPEGLDVILDHWLSTGGAVALPELLAAAPRDRLELSPQNWIASRARLDAAERSVRDRLPERRTLAGQLVDGALQGSRLPWFAVTRRLLRHRLGLGRLSGIEVHAGYEPGGLPALFRQLGLDLTLVGQRAELAPVLPQPALPVRRKILAAAAAQ